MKPWLPRHWPLTPTLIVAALVAVMISLGFWQIRRAHQKNMFLTELRHNPARPPRAYPEMGPITPDDMLRRSSVNCLSVESWRQEAGRAANGASGFRYIAHCRTSAEGPGALVSLGVAPRPDFKPAWNGGIVTGWISTEPDHRSLLSRAIGPKTVLRPMLIAERSPDPGLAASALPSVDDIPNNHIAYAVQWFIFAAIAAIIYTLALAKRQENAQPVDAKPRDS